MLNNSGNMNKNLFSKNDVFDALYKCCEVNENDEVSLESVILYISREIDCKLIKSQYIIDELQEKLKNQNQNGWLPFAEVCDIFGSWMDTVTERLSDDFIGTDVIQFSPELSPISPKSPSVKKIVLTGLLRDKPNIPEEFLQCEKCGKEEDCCEWRNNVSNREEKLTKCYEQRVAELQNLLRQSEDCNTLLQLENESLHEQCAVLQGKEQRWIDSEEDFKEHELQLTSTNTLLNEQIHVAEKEIQHLKQQLCHLKSENENLLTFNQKLEERVAERTKIEKMLNETKAQLSVLQFDIHSKDVAFLDIEIKFENLQEHNQILQERILELEANNYAVHPTNEHFEQSICEEMSEMFTEDYLSIENSDSECLEAREISTLKDELEACLGQYPLSCDHVSTQTSFSVETSATQTEEWPQISFTEISDRVPKENLQNKESNEAPLVFNPPKNYCKCETSNSVTRKPLISSYFSPCSKLHSDSECRHVDMSVQTLPIEVCGPNGSPIESDSCIPIFHSYKVEKRHDFCSTCEMEIYLVVNRSTQTECSNLQERKPQPVTSRTVARREFTSNNENRVDNPCKVLLLTSFTSKTDLQFHTLKLILVSRGVVKNVLSSHDHLIHIPRNSYQHSALWDNLRNGRVMFCRSQSTLDPTNALCNTVTAGQRKVSHCDAVVPFRRNTKWISTAEESPYRIPILHCSWWPVFQILTLFFLFWMCQADDKNWYTESSVWNEMCRALTPKVRVRFNEPPPQ